jgi:hypothetical protein
MPNEPRTSIGVLPLRARRARLARAIHGNEINGGDRLLARRDRAKQKVALERSTKPVVARGLSQRVELAVKEASHAPVLLVGSQPRKLSDRFREPQPILGPTGQHFLLPEEHCEQGIPRSDPIGVAFLVLGAGIGRSLFRQEANVFAHSGDFLIQFNQF